MLSGVRTGNSTPHDKYNVHGIAHARINRKDDIFMQRRLVQLVGGGWNLVNLTLSPTMVLSRQTKITRELLAVDGWAAWLDDSIV